LIYYNLYLKIQDTKIFSDQSKTGSYFTKILDPDRIGLNRFRIFSCRFQSEHEPLNLRIRTPLAVTTKLQRSNAAQSVDMLYWAHIKTNWNEALHRSDQVWTTFLFRPWTWWFKN